MSTTPQTNLSQWTQDVLACLPEPNSPELLQLPDATEFKQQQLSINKDSGLTDASGDVLSAERYSIPIKHIGYIISIRNRFEYGSRAPAQTVSLCQAIIQAAPESLRSPLQRFLEDECQARSIAVADTDTNSLPSYLRPSEAHIKMDIHMMRAAYELKQLGVMRLYFIMRYLDVDYRVDEQLKGQGHIALDDLKRHLKAIGFLRQTATAWLNQGNKLGYWHLTESEVYYKGITAISAALTR